MASFNRLVARLADASLVVAGVSLGILAVVQLAHVVGRYMLNSTPSWTEPVSIVLMNITMLLGAAVAVHRNSHFAFTVGIDRLPAHAHQRARSFVQLVIAAVGLVLAWQGMALAMAGWDVKAAGVNLPQGLVYVPMVIGGVLIGLFGLAAAGKAGGAE
jgi:TRAP-type C4-dicarboxylate transport system permease small subunit